MKTINQIKGANNMENQTAKTYRVTEEYYPTAYGIRESGTNNLIEGFDSREDARAWMAKNAKKSQEQGD